MRRAGLSTVRFRAYVKTPSGRVVVLPGLGYQEAQDLRRRARRGEALLAYGHRYEPVACTIWATVPRQT